MNACKINKQKNPLTHTHTRIHKNRKKETVCRAKHARNILSNDLVIIFNYVLVDRNSNLTVNKLYSK